MNILFFGSSGFLTNSFLKFHLKKGDKIYIVSRQNSLDNLNIKFIGIKDFINCFGEIKKIKFDICYYFIADNIIKKKNII